MKRKRKLKIYSKLVIVLITFSIFFIFSLVLINISINIKNNHFKSLLKYQSTSNINYNVYLKENNYFSMNVLPQNEQYIANMIDKVKPTFSYFFTSNNKFDYTYSYKIIGKLVANHDIDSNNSKKVWEKDYILLEEKTKNMKNSNNFSIRESIDVDFQKFSEYIQEFKKDYTLSISSDLEVYMIVNINGKISNKDVNKSSKMSLDIPLSEQSFNISTNYKKDDFGNINKNINNSKIKNLYLITGLIVFLISLLIIIIDIIKLYRYQKTHKKYSKELNKILSSYKDILVASKELIDLDEYKVIDLEIFEDMLDVEQELRIPIIYKEVKEEKETWFIIINNDQAWRYILNNNSL